MGEAAEKLTFTYKDYLSWPREERWELIGGKTYDMSPAPSMDHQKILGELFTEFNIFLRGTECTPFMAPLDVCLPREGEDPLLSPDVVQPDLLVYCEKEKMTPRGGVGAPTLVIEILSPSTALKDKKEKFLLYQKHGVKEYWLVYPGEEIIEIFLLKDDGFYGASQTYGKKDRIPVKTLPGLTIPLETIFK